MEEEDFSKLQIEERCTHKVWKARVSGYEAAANLFRQIDDEKSPEWSKYVGLVKKFVIDSNAPAQEKGLEAVLAFVENCASAGKTVNDVMSGLVNKCISAPKARTKELAGQIALMYIEIEKHEAVLDELMKGTESKNPKILAASVHIINQALKEFGAKVINISKILKRVLKLLEDRDNNVRAEAKLLLVEMYRWLGPAIKPQMASLKQVQITEMETEFEKVKDVHPKPTRLLRSQQIKKEQAAAQEGDESGEDETQCTGTDEIDPYDLLEPVDILSQLPKSFYTQLEAKKWSERKEALEALEKSLASAPKLENADYGDLMRALKKVIAKDSNVVVVGAAIKCVSGLASGLKKKFHQYAGVMMPALFEKFKEKKQNVVLALREAVDAVYLTTSLELILEDVIASLENKNPSVKAEIASFLARCFAKSTPAVLNKKLLKPLTKSLLKCLVDQDPSVRDNAAQALGTAMKAAGEKSISPFLVDVDNQKMVKIKECYEKAELLVKPAKTVKQNKSESTKKIEPSNSAQETKPKHAVVVKPLSGVLRKKACKAKLLSRKEALEKARNVIPGDVLDGLKDADDNERLKAYTEFSSAIKDLKVEDETGQILMYAMLPDIERSETITETVKTKLEIIKHIAEKMSLSEECVAPILLDIVSALLIPECTDLIGETLWALINNVSLDCVAHSLLEDETIQSDPRLWSEILNWLSSAITDYNTGTLEDCKFIEECGRKAFAHSNAAVSKGGLTLIGSVHILSKKSTTSVSAQQPEVKVLKTLPKSTKDTEMRSIEKTVPAQTSSASNISTSTTEPATRIDIGPQITDQLVAELGDKNWKVRAEAVCKFQAIVSSAKSITTNLGEAPPAIAARLNDSNTKIAQSAIALVHSLAQAIGPSCKQHLRSFLPPLLKIIGDPKVWIRSAVIACLNTWGEIGGYKEFFEGEIIADALKTGSPTLRSELWCWLAEKLPIVTPKTISKDELTACLPTLYTNLEDRNADVRKNACEAVLGFMIHLGFNNMNTACDNILKGTSGSQVKVILEKTRGSLPEKPAPKLKSQALPEKVGKSVAVGKLAPGSSATITKSTSKAKAPASVKTGGSRKKEEDVDTNPLLQVNNMKHQRVIDEQKLKTLKWNFVTPRAEFIELLKEQMLAANVNKTLISNMFHIDFKYHLRAIDALIEDLPHNRTALISNLDLILRWMTIRFFDTNPSVLLKGLEYLNTVFHVLIEEEYSMLDSEASAFLPYLILKVGDPKDTVRISVRALFKLTGSVYPQSKQFPYIMEGVKSKNARQRAECLEHLCWLIDNYGLCVCHPSPSAALKEIAKHIADRDTSVRNAAINLVVTAYFLEGEKILKMVSQISDKDLCLLEERIKRANKNRPIASVKPLQPVPCSSSGIQPVQDDESGSVEDEYMQEDVYEPPQTTIPVAEPPPRSENSYNMEESRDETEDCENTYTLTNDVIAESPVPTETTREATIPGPYDLDQRMIDEMEGLASTVQVPKLADVDLQFLHLPSTQATVIKPIQMPRLTPTLSNFTQPTAIKWELSQIASSDIDKAMASLLQIDTVLNSEKRSHLSGFVDYMVQQLVQQLINLNQSAHPEVVNCYRANFALLMKLTNYPELCGEVSQQTLYKLIEQLLHLLTEKTIDSLDKNELFTRVVNSLVLRVLEQSNKTNIMCALLQMLHFSIKDEDMTAQYQDLVVKSLWKLNRTQHKWDSDLDYAKLIAEFHNFFREFPSSWWKTQPADVPLRTVKTILHTMIKIRGTQVRDVIKSMPHISPEAELACYVRKLIKHLKIDEAESTAQAVKKNVGESAGSSNGNLPQRLSKAVQDELQEIFRMIGDTEETSEGIIKLYHFTKTHSEIDIQPFLAKGTPVFQQYIRRGLAALEEQSGQSDRNRNRGASTDASSLDNQPTNKKLFSKEAERLWNRLHHLQEKAGCHVEKPCDEVKEPPKEKLAPKKKSETYDADLQSIKERFELIKTNLG